MFQGFFIAALVMRADMQRAIMHDTFLCQQL